MADAGCSSAQSAGGGRKNIYMTVRRKAQATRTCTLPGTGPLCVSLSTSTRRPASRHFAPLRYWQLLGVQGTKRRNMGIRTDVIRKLGPHLECHGFAPATKNLSPTGVKEGSQCVKTGRAGAQTLHPAKIVHHDMGGRDVPIHSAACRRAHREAAKALATAQLRSPPHLNLHACSAHFRKIMGSLLALAPSRRLRNSLVSSDLQPLQPGPPTMFRREVWPTRRRFSLVCA